MKKDGTIAMFRYWNTLRAGRIAPYRSDIDPTAIKGRLPETFILELDEPEEVRFRLAGTNVCAVFGQELRHLSFASLWRAQDQATLAELARNAMIEGAVVLAECAGTTRQGRRAVFELLLLPLDAGPGRPRAIGTLIALDRPYWLGAHPVVDLSLEFARLIDPQAAAILDVGRATPSIAPDAASLLGGEQAPRRVRHLVVLEGGKPNR